VIESGPKKSEHFFAALLYTMYLVVVMFFNDLENLISISVNLVAICFLSLKYACSKQSISLRIQPILVMSHRKRIIKKFNIVW
jgi:hypothetical protein